MDVCHLAAGHVHHRDGRAELRAVRVCLQRHGTTDGQRLGVGDIGQQDRQLYLVAELLRRLVQHRLQLRRGAHGRVLPAHGLLRLFAALDDLPEGDLIAVFHVQCPDDVVVGAGACHPVLVSQQRAGIVICVRFVVDRAGIAACGSHGLHSVVAQQLPEIGPHIL